MADSGGDGETEMICKSKATKSWIPNIIKKRVCSTFVEDSVSDGKMCQCGKSKKEHPPQAIGDHFSAAMVNCWDTVRHSSESPTDAFGELQFAGASKRHSYFLRLSWGTNPSTIYNLMTVHWSLPSPNLVVSVVGGESQKSVKTWVREVIRKGLVKSSQRAGAWIITEGLREGVGKCVGEAVRDHATAASSGSSNKVVAVGIASWGLVYNKEQLINPEGSYPAKYDIRNSPKDSCCLDNNYQAFLLVDDGSVDRRGGEISYRAKLEDYISHQPTGIQESGINVPVLCMLISGDPSMLKRVDLSLKNSMPWLVLAGSGGLADFLSDVVENVSSSPVVQSPVEADGDFSPMVDLKEKVADRVKKYFPNETETAKVVEQTLSIYQNKDLITVYNGPQEGLNDFDTVLLKALVRASKQRVSVDDSPYNEELRLAVTWNRVDIARSELFNGDILWKDKDLKDSMTNALINDKPQFVRLFTENGFDIQSYLTYRKLEKLYQSVPTGTLLYQLLERRLLMRQGITAPVCALESKLDSSNHKKESDQSEQVMKVTLFEVSGVLDMLLDDVCQPFYYDVLDLAHFSSRRRALKQAAKLLVGKGEYREKRCFYPWASLFIWAILQRRNEMATFFWEMAGESVLTALSGCKMLREMSKLETETEGKLSLKEMAQSFENLAHDIFSSCYRSDENRAFTLLIKKSPVWGGTTCLQMGMGADTRLFFSHDGVQSLLSQIWWGDMKRNTEVWKLLLTFFCPILCYTNLISFRKQEEQDNKLEDEEGKPNEDHVDSNYDYGTTVFSYPDMKHIDGDAQAPVSPSTPMIDKDTLFRPPRRPFIVSRWRQFWFAPVTSFLGNVVMYFLFLVLFAYVLLVDFKLPLTEGPAVSEYVLYFWVFTIVCEEIRETAFLGMMSWRQRLKSYIQDVWNKIDIAAIILFIVGLICRMYEKSYEFGREVLCVDYMVFTLRLIHIFAIHKQLGPKIIIVGKMMKDIFFFLFFLGVWLIAYGVANQALIYSYDSNPDRIFRRVFYRPYLHIFGQIPVEEIDSGKNWDLECTKNRTFIDDGSEPCRAEYSNWVVVVLLVIYLLVTNILLINLLIAMFSHTFSEVQANSDIYWKFQRYNLIVTYHFRPSLAPPFIIISHINLFIKRVIRKVPSIKVRHFVLQLKGKAANKLTTWETIQKEDFLTAKGKTQKHSDSERFRQISAKMDGIQKNVAETKELEHRLRSLENDMEYCSKALSWIVETLAQSSTFKHPRPPPSFRDSSSSTSS
ncbi:Transient receptor potential cation channel subfamily M member 4 [Oryzias melastigma]|uniref:Transient receptor potential cation channel subfamily M member 4 n=1 Tax=Oryzias melastigma TaxID=30732 RepID=A0A834KXD1_ORYME|nr:Transient receptor potential cation channel subfamily M member 4 [Oryzias melastigma]